MSNRRRIIHIKSKKRHRRHDVWVSEIRICILGRRDGIRKLRILKRIISLLRRYGEPCEFISKL